MIAHVPIKIILVALGALAVVPLLPQRSIAQWTSVGDVQNFEKMERGIIITARSSTDFAHIVKIQLLVYSSEVIRVRMTTEKDFFPDSSWAVLNKIISTDTNYYLREMRDTIIISTSQVTVKINRFPFRIAFYDAAGRLINQDDPVKGSAWSGKEVAVWKTMPEDEYYFGFGEKAGTLQKKWKAMSMWNSDIPGYRPDTDPLYQSIPFFYAIRKGVAHGIFFDNTYYSYFNMGKENPKQYSFGALGGELNYYFIYGPTPKEVLGRFSLLVGKMPLPPKWSVAYQQCRFSYYPESQVRRIAKSFRKKKIPCDVIYLDIHYMDGFRCFTWDRDRFPNPRKMVSDLAKDGFKVVVIIDPGIKSEVGYFAYDEGLAGDNFVKYPDGKLYTGKVWPGECAFPDFTNTRTREWWGSLYKGLVDTGIKGFWNDMNEPAVFDVPWKTFDFNVMHNDMARILIISRTIISTACKWPARLLRES